MSRPHFDDGHGGAGTLHYYPDHTSSPRQRPSVHTQSRIPRPGFTSSDRAHAQSPMRLNQPSPSDGRTPQGPPDPHQQYYVPQNPAWETSQNLYDGSGYDYAEDYGQDSHWPLPAPPPASSSPVRSNPGPRRTPPQRPQRPDEQPQRPEHQPRVLDPPRSIPHIFSANRNDHQPAPPPASHHGNGRWTGEGYSYAPPPNYPLPSRPPPENTGTLGMPTYQPPQAPAPQQAVYGRANQRPPLGPPPSARRGPAHYYPQVGPVQPILEETDSMRGSIRTGSTLTAGHDSKASFASSNAIPIGISQFHLDRGQQSPHHALTRPELLSESEDEDYDDSSTEPAVARGESRTPQPGHISREKDGPSPGVMVVRQASVGKKSTPTLTTVKSGDKMRKSSGEVKSGIASLPSQQQRESTIRPDASTPDAERMEQSRASAQEALEGPASPGAMSVATEQYTLDHTTDRMQPDDSKQTPGHRTPEKALKTGTSLLDPSSESEFESVNQHQRSKELLGAELVNQLHPQRSQPRSPLAPAVDPRVESIIGSLEKGGALTTEQAKELKQPIGGLSERANRRRPPRLNVDAVRDAEARGSLTSLPDLIRRATKLASNLDRGKTASRLGMNWFDGADDGEKRRSGSISDALASFPPPHNLPTPTESRAGRWSSRMRHSALDSDSDADLPKQRRPCCGMRLWVFILLMVVLFLLIAAAVIVPVVLIVIPKHNDNGSSNQVGNCQKKLTCENGGTNILSSNGFCECLCVNGYTGITCTTRGSTGCTNTSVGSAENATVGEAIPRLFADAETNFSIPLDTQELLGLFSSSDMNCNIQNNLVTFNGESRKRSLEDFDATRTLEERQDSASGTNSAATSNGIVYASETPTAASSAATSTPTSNFDDSTTLDFARVAVLYVFQASQELTTAADAQDNLQAFLSNGHTASGQSANARNVSLGNGYTADMTSYSVSIGDGTTVGGTGGNTS